MEKEKIITSIIKKLIVEYYINKYNTLQSAEHSSKEQQRLVVQINKAFEIFTIYCTDKGIFDQIKISVYKISPPKFPKDEIEFMSNDVVRQSRIKFFEEQREYERSSNIVRKNIFCPKCGTNFSYNDAFSGRLGGIASGAITGAITGAKFGIAGGPLGAIAGTIPGILLGSIFGSKIGNNFDKPKCPNCKYKVNI